MKGKGMQPGERDVRTEKRRWRWSGLVLDEKKREATHKEKRRDVRRFSLARLRRTTLLLY